MDIPLNAKVYTKDGHVGRSMCIIVNPIKQNVTHFVLRRKDEFGYQELVPVALIKETTPDMILLNCHTHELAELAPFTKSEFIELNPNHASDPAGLDYAMFAWPYSPYDVSSPPMITVEQIPYDELGIHRGAQVEATDGRVGRVGEFLVEPENCHITHLVLHENHFWGDKAVTIPIAAIDKIETDVVRLKLSRDEVKKLPHLAAQS
ncbi:MAG: PRC-barrel domain-containing protein [Caldilineaceae bacterium]